MAGPIDEGTTTPPVSILRHIDEVLGLVRALRPADGLPAGTLILPNARMAQAVRKAALPDVGATLNGWRLLAPIDAAIQVVGTTGQPLERPRAALRAVELEALFADGAVVGLEYFAADQLAGGSGYAQAFAATIQRLAAAGWTAAGLSATAAGLDEPDGPRVRDIARVWASLPSAAEPPDSAAIFTRACGILGAGQGWWPHPGPALAVLVWPSVVEVQFLAALPQVRAAVLRGRPERPEYRAELERIAAAFGDPTLPRRLQQPAGGGHACELDLLQAFIFEPPDPQRPRSAGLDGSVHFEIHAGTAQELQATVEWIGQQVYEHRTALEDIAVLLPEADPYAGMLVDRLRTLEWGTVEPPVYVANGLPLHRGALTCGVQATLAALEQYLFAESLHGLIPHLRPQDLEYPLSYAQAGELVYSCGIAGGMPGAPAAGRQWVEVFERRAAQARGRAFRSRGADDAEEGREVRGRKREQSLLQRCEALQPAIAALVDLYEQVCGCCALPQLVAALRGFIDQHLYRAESDAVERQLLNEQFDALQSLAAAERLCGRAALRALRRGLRELRRPCGELGAGHLFVGTLDRAAGLRFDAVRIIGLTEGTVPPTPREDAVLPEVAAAALDVSGPGAEALPAGVARPDGAGEYIVRRLHEFVFALGCARRRIVLSTAQQTIDGQIREPSSVFLEAALAIGRGAGGVPSGGLVNSAYFRPGLAAREAFAAAVPLTASALCRGVARQTHDPRRVPARWLADDVRSVVRLGQLHARRLQPLDLAGVADGKLPGLTAGRAISQTRLRNLLSCPMRFVWEDVLGWEEVFEPPSTHEIDPLRYGTLLHRVMQRFYEQHGLGFFKRPQPSDEWEAAVEAIAETELAAFMEEYPLVGEATIRRERRRLLGDARRLVRMDAERGPGRVLAVEWEFGMKGGVPLAVGDEGRLFVRGIIDRVEETRDGGGLQVWDIKSGRLRGLPDVAEFEHDRQLALYATALEVAAPRTWAPLSAVGYISPQSRGRPTRTFEGQDLVRLKRVGQGWWELALTLLSGRRFPHAVDAGACRYCHFNVLCGEKRWEQAREVLQDSEDEGVRGFVAFRSDDD